MSASKTLPAVVFAAAVLIATGSVEADNWLTRMLGGKSVKGSGDMVTESRVVKEFTWIETLGAFDISVKSGKKQEILLTFDDNLLDLIETDVSGKTLKIYSDEPYRSRHTCKVEITVPKLEGVTTKGSGDITVRNFDSEVFECRTKGSGDISVKNLNSEVVTCNINGSGNISIYNLNGDFLECHINGSGDFRADGQVKQLDIRVRGSGDVDTRDLIAQEAEVVIKGSGDVRVYAEESLDGAVYGSGDISYYGKPEHVSKRVAGSGDIRKR